MKRFTHLSPFVQRLGQMPARLALLVFLLGRVYSPYAQTFLGLTSAGGADNAGAIVLYDGATNTLSAAASFPITAVPGKEPAGNLTLSGGKFYGMTYQDGSGDNHGVIFEWDPVTNVYTKKMEFDGANGRCPKGSLTLSGGKFYGMTSGGGTNGVGVIFEWDPATNTFTKKVEFDGTNGRYPTGSLAFAGGKFYGMTSYGGNSSDGGIFEWDPSINTLTQKVEFNGINGELPNGSLTLYGGKFYGMTILGGSGDNHGVIFEWDPATNVYTKKMEFDGANGRSPKGDLTLFGGKFYGLTENGGPGDFGVIFEWDPVTNVYTNHMAFNGLVKGAYPLGSLTLSGGKFYGMTSGGGMNNSGVLFEWDPADNTFTKMMDLGGTNGEAPSGDVILSGGKLYGMTKQGGTGGAGVIFEWDPATATFTKKVDFEVKAQGAYPVGSLIPAGSKFYGMTNRGGISGFGVIFEWDPATSTFTKKVEFDGTNGSRPNGSLTLSGGKFYGMTYQGGTNNQGVIFEWDPATNALTKKVDFNYANGTYPYGNLTESGGKFYGMTTQGGTYDKGVIFEWDPATNVYTKHMDFNGSARGAYPNGSLTLSGGKFYGMTKSGGTSNFGVIFEWDPATNSFTKKVDFDGNNGSNPFGSLTLSGGKFYGMTSKGGKWDYGVIFEWNPVTNTFIKKMYFDYWNGVIPYGSLTLAGGKFYGMTAYGATSYGSTSSSGMLFEWDPATNTFTKQAKFNGTNGANPMGDLTVIATPNAISDPRSASGLVAWPNPATNRLMVQVPAGNELLTLTDPTGRTVRTAALNGAATTLPLDLSGLAAGVYTLRVGAVALRVVKE